MSVYKIVELVGTSTTSWEDAAKTAIEGAKKSLRHLRVAEVSELDVTLTDQGDIELYRVKVKLSLKHESS